MDAIHRDAVDTKTQGEVKLIIELRLELVVVILHHIRLHTLDATTTSSLRILNNPNVV
jgi:hypothetical protein